LPLPHMLNQTPNKSSTTRNWGKKNQEPERDYITSSSLRGQEACAQQAKHDQKPSEVNAMNCKLIPCTPSDEQQESMVQVRWLQHKPGSGSAAGQGTNEEKLEELLKPRKKLTCSAHYPRAKSDVCSADRSSKPEPQAARSDKSRAKKIRCAEKNQEIQSKALALMTNQSVRVPGKIQPNGRQRA
jgi:hypothetical protein